MRNDFLKRIVWGLCRINFWIFRLRALPRANRIFRDAHPGTILRRSLFGYTYFADVSRASPQRLIYLEGERFIPEAGLIASLVKPGFHVIDIGANVGYCTLLLARAVGESGSIMAIEPSPENLPELHLNVGRNNLGARVEIVEAAVGDRTSIVGLREGINSGVTQSDATYRVRLDTIDNMIKKRADFIKMDIEGFEIFALKGGQKVLERDRPVLFVEIHPKHLAALGSSAREVISLLGKFYRKIEIYDQALTGTLWQKLLRAYLGIGSVPRIRNVDRFIATIETTQSAVPFWAVCRHD